MKHRIIFVGTPQFSVPSLVALLNDSRFEVVGVVTQPDMPAGRNLALTPPPIKVTAQSYSLPIFQPQKIAQVIDQLRELQAEAMVVAVYSQIIPDSILQLTPKGCVNVHPSRLPKYRGASVLQAPILHGDPTADLSIMLMDKTLDTGPILSRTEYVLKPQETAATLSDAMSELSAKVLPETLAAYLEDRIKPLPQDDSETNYVGRLEKKDGIIDWTKSAAEVERFVRAMFPWPSAWTWIAGKQLKILEVDPHIVELSTYKPGKTFVYNSSLAVQCGKDSLIIRRLQLEGKKAMTSEEFIRGYKDFVGTILG